MQSNVAEAKARLADRSFDDLYNRWCCSFTTFNDYFAAGGPYLCVLSTGPVRQLASTCNTAAYYHSWLLNPQPDAISGR